MALGGRCASRSRYARPRGSARRHAPPTPRPPILPGSGAARAPTAPSSSSDSAPRGCCAFPRRWRSTRRATCTSPTSSATSCRSSAPPARSRPSGAPTAAATASSVRSAGWRPTPQATSTWSTRATTGSRSSTRTANFLTAWGARGERRSGEFKFGSSQNSTQPPGGGIAVPGDHVYVADSGNDRIERFNLEGGEAIAWGTLGSGARPVLLPARRGGERKRGARHRRRQPPHRAIRPRRRRSRAQTGSAGRRARTVRLSLRRRARRRRQRVRGRRHQPSRRQAQPAAGVRGRVGRSRRETGAARVPARARERPGRRHLRGGHRQRPRRGVRPGRQLPAHARGSRPAEPGGLTAPRGLAIDPTGRLLVSDTVGNRIETVRARQRRLRWPVDDRGRPSRRLRGAERASASIRAGSVYVADTRQRATRASLGRRHVPLRNRRPRRSRRGAAERPRARSPSPPAPDQTYVADSGHNRVLVYSAGRRAAGEVGRRRRRRLAGSGSGRVQPSRTPSPSTAAGNVYVADTGNDRVVEALARRAACSASGARAGTATGAFARRPASPSTPPGSVYVLDSENNRVAGVRRRRAPRWPSGGCGARTG